MGRYLHDSHVADKGGGCPLAALLSELDPFQKENPSPLRGTDPDRVLGLMALMLGALILARSVAEASRIGHKKYTFGEESGHLWYPTASDVEPKAQRYHPLPVYASIRVVENAQVAPGRRPLILLSHTASWVSRLRMPG